MMESQLKTHGKDSIMEQAQVMQSKVLTFPRGKIGAKLDKKTHEPCSFDYWGISQRFVPTLGNRFKMNR